MRPALVLMVCLGCRATAVQEPRPTPVSEPTSQRAEVPGSIEVAPTTQSAPPQQHPPPTPPASRAQRSVRGESCTGTQGELDACQAMGTSCKLAALPEILPPSPCANKGTRCLDEIGPTPRDAPCHCSCGARYQAAQRAVDHDYAQRYEAEHRNDCTELVDLSTGKKKMVCKPPRKPQ